MVYHNLNRTQWPKRDVTNHRRISKRIKQSKTQANRSKLETEYRLYYSILTDLEYFDPITHTVIDPMHNLFLGTAKRIFKKIWIPKGFFKRRAIERKTSSCGQWIFGPCVYQ